MKRKPPSYKGVLLEPITINHFQDYKDSGYNIRLETQDTKRRMEVEIDNKINEKLPLLYQTYHIPKTHPEKWKLLALSLAQAHIPGFQINIKKNKPLTETTDSLSRLYRFYLKKKRARKISNHQVCIEFKKDPQFDDEFPEFRDCGVKRLQNLLSKSLQIRRARVEWLLSRYIWLKQEKSGNDILDRLPRPPPWVPLKSVLFEKYKKI